MNPILVVILFLLVGAFAASAVNLSAPAALLFALVGFMIWAGVGAASRRFYQSRNHLDELRRQDIPMTLWLLSMGSVGFGLHDSGADMHHGASGGWSEGGGGFSDGGGGGGDSGGGM